jgi:D-aminoacyl-tRNA deacylase
MILIVASNKDVASLNIRKQMLDRYSFDERQENFQSNPTYQIKIDNKNVELVTLNGESVQAQNLPDAFIDLELVIFISRHSSLSGTPTLSVHTPGNLAKAELGGIPNKVSISPANAMRKALMTMAKLKDDLRLDYQVCYEGTHHGPSLDVPTMFAELGSSLRQWQDARAAEVVAHATMETAKQFGSKPVKTVLGIGGPHYNSKFTRMALESEVAFGHIIPKYAVPEADVNVLKQCVERTSERVKTTILDWKGIKGENKDPLIKTLMEMSIPFEKI